MVDRGGRFLLIVEHAQLAIEPLLLEGIELGGQERKRI
jgi:hypothetical protein